MADLPSTALCASHADQIAVALCDGCGRPLCSRCRVDSLATEQVFCSEACREHAASAGAAGSAGSAVSDDAELLRDFESPIRSGWLLWLRNLGDLFVYIGPVALAMGAVQWVDDGSALQPDQPLRWASFLLPALGVYGAALIGVRLSARHTGFAPGNAYLWTLRRLGPWLGTWVLVTLTTVIGFILLIVPGVVASLRLFWADEFALVHRAGPIEAVRRSWQLTEGYAGPIFGFQLLLGFAQYLVLIPLFFLWVALVQALGESPVSRFLEATLSGLLFFFGYAAVHGPELVYFYGLRATATSGRARRGDLS